jgi:hypothetical protein
MIQKIKIQFSDFPKFFEEGISISDLFSSAQT